MYTVKVILYFKVFVDPGPKYLYEIKPPLMCAAKLFEKIKDNNSSNRMILFISVKVKLLIVNPF
jgi:hypothetical protein